MSRMLRVRAAALPVAALLAVLLVPRPAAAQDSPAAEAPASQSAVSAREIVELLKAKNLTSFAVKDPENQGRFVAVLHIPDVQLMVVSAKYGRSTDIDYRLYHKDYMTAYMDLNSSTLSSEKVFIEDTHADGLMLAPPEGSAGDVIRTGEGEQVFDGEFADPRRRNDKRMPQADYYTAFKEADASYTRLLALMLAELKKSAN